MLATSAKSVSLVGIAAAWETAVEHIINTEFRKNHSGLVKSRVADHLRTGASRM